MQSPVKRLLKKAGPDRSGGNTSNVGQVIERPVPPRQIVRFGRTLGFSVETDSLQMAAVRHLGKRRQLLDIKKIYLSPTESDPTRRLELVNSAIDEFLEKYHSRGSRITLTVSGNETAFRRLHLPSMRKSDLASAIKLEARKQIPFSAEKSHLGFRTTCRVSGGERSQHHVALFAATDNLVSSRLAIFRKRGLLVDHVYHVHEAVGRLLKDLPDFSPTEAYCLLNVGPKSSEIAFYRGTDLEFFHVISFGTRNLADSSEFDRLDTLAEKLSAEMQTSVDYYAGQYRTPTFSSIYLHGDLAYSDELLQQLEDRLGYAFRRFPVEQLNMTTANTIGDAAEIAVCLPALAAAANDSALADLLPAEDRADLMKRRTGIIGRWSVAAIALCLMLGWGVTNRDMRNHREAALVLSRQVEAFQSSSAYHHYNLLKTQIVRARAYLNQAEQEPSYVNLNLKELSRLTPPEIQLLRYTYETKELGDNLSLKGIVSSEQVPPEIVLAEYVEELNASPFYDNVVVKRHVKRSDQDGFYIEFDLVMRGTA